MMEAVRKRKFKAIVVYRLDRISRNITDFAGLVDELTKLDVSFVSIREQFDTSTPMGRAMMFIISVFSQLERETIAERIRDNMHELAKTGRWLGGNAPTGFRSEPVSKVTVDGKNRKSFKLVPIPDEAEIPKLIFDLYTEFDSLTAVEAELFRQRIKTKCGKDFTRFAIKNILQNPVYMVADGGAYQYFVEKKQKSVSRKKPLMAVAVSWHITVPTRSGGNQRNCCRLLNGLLH
jgi:site-specific DNA recombinase